jgi:hypothetical protein
MSERFKSTVIAVALLFAVSFAMGQTPQPAPKGGPTSQKASDATQVKILRVQKHMTELQVQANALQDAMTKAGQDFAKSQKDLGDLVDGAYKEAGLSKTEWDFSVDTFEFSKKAAVKPDAPK